MMALLVLLFCIALPLPGFCEAESILALSDTHIIRNSQTHIAMMEAVVQAAQGRDLVLMTGDNTDNTREEEHVLALQWAGEIERRSGAEVYILPGNHDYGRLTPEARTRLLADENCQKWRRAETRTVVKAWILGLLDHPQGDVTQIALIPSRKRPVNPGQ